MASTLQSPGALPPHCSSVQLLWHSAALARCRSNAPKLRCTGIPLLRRDSAPSSLVLHFSGALVLYCRGTTPLQHPAAFAPASLCCSSTDALYCTALATNCAGTLVLRCSGNPALRDSMPCCLAAPPLECPTASALWSLTALHHTALTPCSMLWVRRSEVNDLR